MLAELIGHIIVGVVRVMDVVFGPVGGLFALEEKMKEGTRVGESAMEAESRRWWQRVGEIWYLIGFVLLLIALLLGVAVEWR